MINRQIVSGQYDKFQGRKLLFQAGSNRQPVLVCEGSQMDIHQDEVNLFFHDQPGQGCEIPGGIETLNFLIPLQGYGKALGKKFMVIHE